MRHDDMTSGPSERDFYIESLLDRTLYQTVSITRNKSIATTKGWPPCNHPLFVEPTLHTRTRPPARETPAAKLCAEKIDRRSAFDTRIFCACDYCTERPRLRFFDGDSVTTVYYI